MTGNTIVPVIVGVGDVINRSTTVEDAIEPRALMLQAIRAAIVDTGISSAAQGKLQSSIDDVGVVNTWTWQYHDLPQLLCEDLAVRAKYKHLSQHGGNAPGLLFDHAVRRVSRGETNVAVVIGGEALASRKCRQEVRSSGTACRLTLYPAQLRHAFKRSRCLRPGGLP